MSSPKQNTSSWFVATKLKPPLIRSDVIRRAYLEEAFRYSVSNVPITLVSAPAGYGKTTLLSMYFIKKTNGMGYALTPMLLTLCVYIGNMVVSQTMFQISAEIELHYTSTLSF